MLLLLYVCLVTSALFCSSPDLLTHPVAAGSEAENVFNGNLGFELICAEKPPLSLSPLPSIIIVEMSSL